eukprot:1488896-Pleurochrysis_carterae.AAC.3
MSLHARLRVHVQPGRDLVIAEETAFVRPLFLRSGDPCRLRGSKRGGLPAIFVYRPRSRAGRADVFVYGQQVGD